LIAAKKVMPVQRAEPVANHKLAGPVKKAV
jgi:hypothetical protein